METYLDVGMFYLIWEVINMSVCVCLCVKLIHVLSIHLLHLNKKFFVKTYKVFKPGRKDGFFR